MSRRDFLYITGAAVTSAALTQRILAAGPPPAHPRPDLIFIFADQQHGSALGFMDPFFQTPNLDRFAAESLVFERCFCTTPQCSPSRSSLLTGQYPSRTGVWNNINHAGGRPLGCRTLATRLQAAGYRTGYFGKWHLGHRPQAVEGWDVECGVKQERPTPDNVVAQKTVRFIEQADPDQPIALFVSFVEPHHIYDFKNVKAPVPADATLPLPLSWSKDDLRTKPRPQLQFMEEDQQTLSVSAPQEVWQSYRHFYRERVTHYDTNFGGVIEALKRAGRYERSVVMSSSDHGDMDAAHRLVLKGPFMYDQLVRIPLIVRVPSAWGGRPGRNRELVSNADLAPTLCALAGAASPATDGHSIEPLLRGQPHAAGREFVVSQYYGKQQWVVPIRMLRTADMKYVRYRGDAEELYNLRDDPEEIVNLASDGGYAARKRELSALLDNWMKTTDDPFDQLKPGGQPAHADNERDN